MFNPSAALVRVTSQQLIENHDKRRLPLDAMEILRREGHYDILDQNGKLTLSYREMYERTIGLGRLDLSLALINSMHYLTAALIADDSVPAEQQAYIASLIKSSITAAFVSGRYTRSEAGPLSFLTDVRAKKLEVRNEKFWQVNGTKGVATNAEGCDYALVTFKDEDDKSPAGALFGLVKMHSGSGFAPGITVRDTGDTLGVPSTRSGSVDFKGVLVPEGLVLPWYENSLGHFLGKNGKASFGAYTGAYLGACHTVLDFFTRKKSQYKTVVRECSDAVAGAEQILMKAAALIDRGRPADAEEVTGLLLQAKLKAGGASKKLIGEMGELGGFHDFLRNGEDGNVLVALLGLFMANAHPPSTPMIRDILSGKIVLP